MYYCGDSKKMNENRDIVSFYYYSNPVFPEKCALGISNQIIHRNIFMLPTGDKIHFEFPSFEDFSYCSMCNYKGVNSLAERNGGEKYIIFRTTDKTTRKINIVGYFKVGRMYYQETDLFNNNGFTIGIESSEVKLLPRNTICIPPEEERSFRRGHRVSWKTPDMKRKLENFLENIDEQTENLKKRYQDETKRLIKMLTNEHEIENWKQICDKCLSKDGCPLIEYRDLWIKKHEIHLFDAIHKAYTNLYTKSMRDQIPRVYLR